MEDNFQKLTDRMTSSQLDLYYAILNEIEQFSPDEKSIIMDVICQLRDGRRIIVEMLHDDCPPGKIIYTYEFREQETGELMK